MKREYCDLCGMESRTSSMRIPISKGLQRLFDVCECCENDLSRKILQTQIDFIHDSKWYKDNLKENGFDYGEFRMVGTAEQGGYVCPKCGHSNNAYTFKNKCQSCGYEKQR